MRTIDLLREPTPRHQGELTWRLGLLFGAANLLLLGIGLAATNPRRASNWNLLFALLGFVVYYNLINLTQAWVAGGRLRHGRGAAAACTAARSCSRWRCCGGATMRQSWRSACAPAQARSA